MYTGARKSTDGIYLTEYIEAMSIPKQSPEREPKNPEVIYMSDFRNGTDFVERDYDEAAVVLGIDTHTPTEHIDGQLAAARRRHPSAGIDSTPPDPPA